MERGVYSSSIPLLTVHNRFVGTRDRIYFDNEKRDVRENNGRDSGFEKAVGREINKYYIFKLHSCFLLIDIHQLILNV